MFKDILVHIDNTQQNANRLELAIRLASEHEAQLTGLYVASHTANPAQGEQARAQELFALRTAQAGLKAAWIFADQASADDILNYYAHTKDLVIVGQTDPDAQRGDILADLPQRVVVGAGRPVLVVPYAGMFERVGKRVVVAWKAGRVSARAVNDALPLLVNAEEVTVLSILEPGEQQRGESRADVGIRANLERHGINVKEVHIVMESIPVANLLMNYAWENSCDLMVMGVYYQKSRWKYDLGPVANDFFEQMTLPVLMAY